jgi:hypothetical protein
MCMHVSASVSTCMSACTCVYFCMCVCSSEGLTEALGGDLQCAGIEAADAMDDKYARALAALGAPSPQEMEIDPTVRTDTDP